MVIGCGEKGQTYLYWKGDRLFELPVSYWASLGWVNSPGYRDGYSDFDRLTIPRCLECHATYFESRQPPINRYSPAVTRSKSIAKCVTGRDRNTRNWRWEVRDAPNSRRLDQAPAYSIRRDSRDNAKWICAPGVMQDRAGRRSRRFPTAPVMSWISTLILRLGALRPA